jgi:hypothetical protein
MCRNCGTCVVVHLQVSSRVCRLRRAHAPDGGVTAALRPIRASGAEAVPAPYTHEAQRLRRAHAPDGGVTAALRPRLGCRGCAGPRTPMKCRGCDGPMHPTAALPQRSARYAPRVQRLRRAHAPDGGVTAALRPIRGCHGRQVKARGHGAAGSGGCARTEPRRTPGRAARELVASRPGCPAFLRGVRQRVRGPGAAGDARRVSAARARGHEAPGAAGWRHERRSEPSVPRQRSAR